MHFLDLASAVEKLRWAEKEWRELDRELAEMEAAGSDDAQVMLDEDDEEESADESLAEAVSAPRV